MTNEDIMVWSNRTLQEHNTGVNQLQIECQGVFHQHLNNLQGALNENIRREGLLPEACQVSRTLQGFKLAVHENSMHRLKVWGKGYVYILGALSC